MEDQPAPSLTFDHLITRRMELERQLAKVEKAIEILEHNPELGFLYPEIAEALQ